MITQTITHEIEYKSGNDFEYLTVEFTGEIDQEDSAFSFSYGSEEGTTMGEKFLTCGNITWDKSRYNYAENLRIDRYCKADFDTLEDQILAAYRNQD